MLLADMRRRIAGLSLSQRFAATGGLVMLAAMIVIGLWVTSRIERNVIDSAAASTALYMDSFIAPLTQELDVSDTLSIGPIRAIEEMLSGSALGERIVAIKIWKPGGLVAYSDEEEIVGKRFPASPSLQAAFAGQVIAEFDDLDDEENDAERHMGVPLLEIYSPLRLAFSGRVIGVMEFYENASTLETALVKSRAQSWAIVGIVGLAIFGALYGIVHRGSLLIGQQRSALQARIAETQSISEQNRALRQRVERASRRVAELNESTLRRISAELHDGPKQLIGFAALRLDAIGRTDDREARGKDIAIVSDALSEALREIGNLCNDLSVPEIGDMRLSDVVRRVAASHANRTGTDVALDLEDNLNDVSQAVRICVYRFVQECLNNAFRHAGGVQQAVSLRSTDGQIELSVNNGAGTPAAPASSSSAAGGLGLVGLRERVESLGGRFDFTIADGRATARMTIGPENRESHE
jgi:signal transduction histidine kinase